MILRIDHIAIAVKNLEKSLASWKKIFQLNDVRVEEIRERGVRLAQLNLQSGPSIELVSSLGEDSAIAKFLEKKGEGIHHFCFEVEDIKKTIIALKEKGIRFVQKKPVKGAEDRSIIFIHPTSLNGVLIELKERKEKT